MIAIMTSSCIRRLFESGRSVALSAGSLMFRANDEVRSALWLETGSAEVSRVTCDGRKIVLSTAKGPCWFAEPSVFAERYHCDAKATTDVVVVKTPKAEFVSAISKDPILAEAVMAALARDLRAARARSEILSLRRVGDRLDAWLAVCGSKPDGATWASVAEELGVSPEALYRELSVRRGRSQPRSSAHAARPINAREREPRVGAKHRP